MIDPLHVCSWTALHDMLVSHGNLSWVNIPGVGTLAPDHSGLSDLVNAPNAARPKWVERL